MKALTLTELREGGYLQESNRRFWHPLGLALAIEQTLGGADPRLVVIDARDDDEGFHFGPATNPMEASERMGMAGKIDYEIENKRAARAELFREDAEDPETFADAVQPVGSLVRIG